MRLGDMISAFCHTIKGDRSLRGGERGASMMERARPQFYGRAPQLALSVSVALFLIIVGSIRAAPAQTTGASARLQQAVGQAQQLEETRQRLYDRRRALLKEQKDLLDQQAQIRKEIPLLQKELKKPLSPEQRDRARCKLRDKSAQYDKERRRQGDIDQQLAQVQGQLSQISQQLAQTQQQVIQLTQEARQEQEAETRASDPLAKFMTAPARPLDGLPVATVPGGRRLIILDIHNVVLFPAFATFTYDPATVTITADAGGAAGFWNNDYIFTMSDGSIQTVAATLWLDTPSPPGPLILYQSPPRLMNAQIASTGIMYGVNIFNFGAGGVRTGRHVLYVPGDPSIQPAVVNWVIR